MTDESEAYLVLRVGGVSARVFFNNPHHAPLLKSSASWGGKAGGKGYKVVGRHTHMITLSQPIQWLGLPPFCLGASSGKSNGPVDRTAGAPATCHGLAHVT